MTRNVGQQRIARHRIGGRQIASRYGLTNLQSPYQYAPGSYTFTAPVTGYWRFVLWGSGGVATTGGQGGASGSYVELTRFLRAQQTVSLVVRDSASTSATTATFLDGTVASAGSANTTTAGTASITGRAELGDVTLSGSLGGASGGANAGAAGLGTGGGAGGAGGSGDPGGAGAPANLPFTGGAGGAGGVTAIATHGRSPGGGGGASVSGSSGGDGLALALLVRE